MTNTATTYAESQRRLPFDWRDFLRRAQAGGATKQEQARAEDLAASWITCACGRQDPAIPRNYRGEPRDNRLLVLGNAFLDLINLGLWPLASKTLDRIEKRSAEILASL